MYIYIHTYTDIHFYIYLYINTYIYIYEYFINCLVRGKNTLFAGPNLLLLRLVNNSFLPSENNIETNFPLEFSPLNEIGNEFNNQTWQSAKQGTALDAIFFVQILKT